MQLSASFSGKLATSSDIPYLLDIAIACYPAFDVDSARLWLKQNIDNTDIICVFTKDALAFGVMSTSFWNPAEKNMEVEFMCGRNSMRGACELVSILREMNLLRKQSGCANMYLNSRLADISPIAKRIGGRPAGMMWVIS